MDIKNGRFYLGDCLEVMKEIPDGVIDMLLVDLPYGTTACSWDSVIPFDKLWEQYNRICKENAAMVFTASQPFTTALIASNINNFKYEWIWQKTIGTNPMLTKKQPFKKHENIIVFYRKQPLYVPQMKNGVPYKDKPRKSGLRALHGDNAGMKKEIINEGVRYPSSVQLFRNPNNKSFHPTQKPVELFEYLIRTYTNKGDLILDNTAGSGTTAIAAENTGRKWVCIEQNEEYATKAVERITNHETALQEKPAGEVQIDSNVPVPEGEENGN